MNSIYAFIAAAMLASGTAHAAGQSARFDRETQTISHMTQTLPNGMQISRGFSPEGSAETLVLYGIGHATQSIHVMAYVLSNRNIIDRLAEKARLGVSVQVIVDYDENIKNDRDGYIQRGLRYLQSAGVQVCSVDQFKIMHDKVMILDGASVQLGSFNYTASGANANSENALILWNDPIDAQAYEQHFQSRLGMCHRV